MRLFAQALVCQRGGRQVFSGVGFELGEGKALAVTGSNGAGKSSLLRMIAGLLRIERGELRLERGAAERSIAEQAHYLGHADALKPNLSVGENLRFWTSVLGAHAAAIEPALTAVRLSTLIDIPAGYLSAGQKRRLSLARLIAVERPIWLLDEPTSALDSNGQATLGELMRKHLARGGMIIAATHSALPLPDFQELRLGAAA